MHGGRALVFTLPPPTPRRLQAALASLASECGGEIATPDLLAALKSKLGQDVWLTCDPE